MLAQSCPLSLYDPMDYSPPGSSVHGILQARTLQWVTISYSTGYSRRRDQTHNLLHLLLWQDDSLLWCLLLSQAGNINFKKPE